MEIITNPSKLQNIAKKYKDGQKKIVLVPTMGALHEGHLKLIDRAKSLGDIAIVSIFVNPTQFGPNEDFAKYPREFENDCKKCENRKADIVFAPSVEEMYPNGFDTKINCGEITGVLEGKSRPGHFDGVCTVVLKLFNISLADIAVFGQKDAQQALVIGQMVRDLNLPAALEIHPTVREKDGLAMSSRNAYLTASERAEVSMICEGLEKLRKFAQKEKKTDKLKDFLLKYYSDAKYFITEYAAVTDFFAKETDEITNDGALVSVAVRTTQSKTRLIDNIIITGSANSIFVL